MTNAATSEASVRVLGWGWRALVVGGAMAVGAPAVAAQPERRCVRDCEAWPDTANAGPRYPEILKSSNVSGEVHARFVVDTTGRFVGGSLQVLRSSHELFTQSMRTAVRSWRYAPARRGGRAVVDTLEYEVIFSLPSVKSPFSNFLEPRIGVRRVEARRWKVWMGWRDVDADAQAPNGATANAVAEVALRAILDVWVPATDGTNHPLVACVDSLAGGRAREPRPAQMARIARPGVTVLPMRRCPRTSVDHARQVTDSVRSAPPLMDPYQFAVPRVREWSHGIAFAEIRVAQGRGVWTYACLVRYPITKPAVPPEYCALIEARPEGPAHHPLRAPPLPR